MSRHRDRNGLQVARGERYALLPREVAESAAYNALPDWSRTVLFALLLQYEGHHNGCLALPYSQARGLGVGQQWKLYAGLRVLTEADLIVCTRQGRLAGGIKLPSMYALTWKGIDDPKEGVVYDSHAACPIPSNTWARWTKPDDWDERVKTITRRIRGKSDHACPFPEKNPDTPREVLAAHPVGSDRRKPRTPRVEKETAILAHPVVVSSKTSAVSATIRQEKP